MPKEPCGPTPEDEADMLDELRERQDSMSDADKDAQADRIEEALEDADDPQD